MGLQVHQVVGNTDLDLESVNEEESFLCRTSSFKFRVESLDLKAQEVEDLFQETRMAGGES